MEIKQMELKQYVGLLWRWAWLMVVGALLAGMVAFLVSLQITPIYQSSTILLVAPASGTNATADSSAWRTSESLAGTFLSLLQTGPVLKGVIDDLRLDVDSEELAGQVNATILRNTQLIALTVDDSDPQRAADIANEFARVVNLQNRKLQMTGYELVPVEAATVPPDPVRPKVWLNTLVAAFVAIMLVVGWLSFIRSPAETAQPTRRAEVLTVVSAKQAETLASTPAMETIPAPPDGTDRVSRRRSEMHIR